MNNRDELRGTLSNTICNASLYPKRATPHLLGGDMSDVLDKTADALIAAGYVKHRTITTAAEVDALPDGSIVRTIHGDGVNIYRNERSLPDLHHHVVLYGPATVLYEPGAQP